MHKGVQCPNNGCSVELIPQQRNVSSNWCHAETELLSGGNCTLHCSWHRNPFRRMCAYSNLSSICTKQYTTVIATCQPLKHTNHVENMWLNCKTKLKRMGDTSRDMICGYLDEIFVETIIRTGTIFSGSCSSHCGIISAALVSLALINSKPLFKATKTVLFRATCDVLKHFVKHASQWLSLKKVDLSSHAEAPPFAADAVRQKSFPRNVDIEQTLLKRGNLRDLFSKESKMAPCIACFSSSSVINNNNRGTERFIGRLKGVVNGLIGDDQNDLAKTDLRICAALHSMV